MTEPGLASSINFLSASTPKPGQGAVSLGAVDSAQAPDRSFSRELVHASERGAQSDTRHDSSSRDSETSAERTAKRPESEQASVSEHKLRRDARSEKVPEKSSSASSASNTSNDESATASQVDAPVISTAASDHEEQVAQTNEVEETASESVPVTPELPVSPLPLVQITDESATDVSVIQLPVKAAVASEQVSVSQNSKPPVQLVDAKQATEKLATAIAPQQSPTNSTDLSATRVVGDQLSPAQLANRQAHRLNSTVGRGTPAAQAVAQETIDAELEVTRPTLAGAHVAGSVAGQLKSQQAVLPKQLDTEVTGATVLSKSGMPIEQLETNVPQRLQHADLAAAAAADLEVDADARLTAQQVKQDVLQENQAQARQVAQQQQVLSANPLLQAVVGDSVSQPADNMVVSLGGGIVTAPVLQRADAANAQLVNAPLNMPILEDEADKAMSGNIRWMVNEGVKNAVVNVTPNGMGPISVTIGLEKDQMNVSIVAMQGSTREALDSMLPRLREQLAAQGHENVKVDISDGRPEQSDRGYGQQYSGDQQQSDRGGRAMGTQVAEEDGSTSLVSETSAAVEPAQVQSTVGNDGKIRRSYDVYV